VTPPLRHNRVFAEGRKLLEGAFRLDHSTSVPDLGSLFERAGDKPLQRLKRDLAQAYGMAWSFPSTHGTTMLNVLALLTACPPGGRVLVNRDAHVSVAAALIHGDFQPVFLTPPYDDALGLSFGPTASDVRDLLARERVDCVFLTSPNYFGVVGELSDAIAAAHERGLPVVVDAAHAPHFRFCDRLPAGAEECGADFVTQSTHKVASTLSQGSLLLVRQAADLERLYEQINALGLVSTSFSYPILASIELGVRQLIEEGNYLWGATLARAASLRDACARLPGVRVLSDGDVGRAGFTALDATRITLDVAATGLTGFEVERRLHRERIYPEMATYRHLLFLLTPGTSDADLYTLVSALRRCLPATACGPRLRDFGRTPQARRALAPRAAHFATKRRVRVREAAGQVSGETIATYPPGVPVVMAGEVLDADVLEYLEEVHGAGAVLKGASDPDFATIKVI
jgi:arginine/lysine/ornithine decarboxylase